MPFHNTVKELFTLLASDHDGVYHAVRGAACLMLSFTLIGIVRDTTFIAIIEQPERVQIGFGLSQILQVFCEAEEDTPC